MIFLIVQCATWQAEAPATDATVQVIAQLRQGLDFVVKRLSKAAADPGPVRLCGCATARQLIQLFANLRQSEPELLCNHYKTQAPEISAFKSALPTFIAPWVNKTLRFVVADRRNGQTSAPGQIPNTQAYVFQLKNPLDLKLT